MGKRIKYAGKVLRKVKNCLFGCACLSSHGSDVDVIGCLPKNSNVHQPVSEAGVPIDGFCNNLAELIQIENSVHASSSSHRHTLRYLMQLEDDEDAARLRHRYTLRYLMHLEDVEDALHRQSRQTLDSPMQLEDKNDESLHTFSDLPVGEFDTVRSVTVEGDEDDMNTLVAVDTDNVFEISPDTRIDEYEVEHEAETCSIVYGQVPIVSELIHVPTFGGEHEGHDPALVVSTPKKEYKVEEGAGSATIVDEVINNAQISPVTRIDEYEAETCSIVYVQVPIVSELVHVTTFGGEHEEHDLAHALVVSSPKKVEEGAGTATIVDEVINNAQPPTFGGEQERHDPAHVASNPVRVMIILWLIILLLLLAVAGVALFG